MKQFWFTLIILFVLLIPISCLASSYSPASPMSTQSSPSTSLNTEQYPSNILDGIWGKSDGVDGVASGTRTLWDGVSGYLGFGAYPFERSFFAGDTVDPLKGLWTSDGHAVSTTASASHLSYDFDQSAFTTGVTHSGTVADTRTADATYHTLKGVADAPNGYGSFPYYDSFSYASLPAFQAVYGTLIPASCSITFGTVTTPPPTAPSVILTDNNPSAYTAFTLTKTYSGALNLSLAIRIASVTTGTTAALATFYNGGNYFGIIWVTSPSYHLWVTNGAGGWADSTLSWSLGTWQSITLVMDMEHNEGYVARGTTWSSTIMHWNGSPMTTATSLTVRSESSAQSTFAVDDLTILTPTDHSITFGAFVSHTAYAASGLWESVQKILPPEGLAWDDDRIALLNGPTQFGSSFSALYRFPYSNFGQLNAIRVYAWVSDGPLASVPPYWSKLQFRFPDTAYVEPSNPILGENSPHLMHSYAYIRGDPTYNLETLLTANDPNTIDVEFVISANSGGDVPLCRFYAIWIEYWYETSQSYALDAVYSVDVFEDDDNPPTAVNSAYLETLVGRVRCYTTAPFAWTGTSSVTLLATSGSPATLFAPIPTSATTNSLPFTDPDTRRWIFPDGTIKIRVQYQSNPAVTWVGANIYVYVDLLQVEIDPLAITFTSFTPTSSGFTYLILRAKGACNIYAPNHALIGSVSSPSTFTQYSFAIPNPSTSIDRLYIQTVSGIQFDWILFSNTLTNVGLRDIDKGGTVPDLYGGTYYADNTVPHAFTATSTSYTETAYFCAIPDYEWFRTSRAVSFTSGGTFRDNGLHLTYQMSDPTKATVKIGLRDTENTWYYRTLADASTWTTVDIPLTEFAVGKTFIQLEILSEDKAGVGSSTVEPFTFELSEFQLIKLTIPQVIIGPPSEEQIIKGTFHVVGNASDDGVIATLIIAIDSTIYYTFTPNLAFYAFDITFNSFLIGDGWHSIWVNATDDEATKNYDLIHILIDNYRDPYVTIQGDIRQICYATLTVEAVVNAITTVTQVTFYLNDSAIAVDTTTPYTTTITVPPTAEGEYTFRATVLDANNQLGSDSISLLVDTTPPPLIEFLTITRNTTLVDVAFITINLDVTSLTSTVTFVEFWINAVLVDTDTATPYTHTFYFTTASNGSLYTIHIIAYDAAGNTNWNEANITYFYTSLLPGNSLLDTIIDIVNWIITFFQSLFGIALTAIITIASGAVAVTRYRRPLAVVAGGSSVLTALISGIVASPAAGIGIGLVTGLCAALGIGTGLLIHRQITPSIQAQCRENPHLRRCSTFLTETDFLPILTGSRPLPAVPTSCPLPSSQLPLPHQKQRRAIL